MLLTHTIFLRGLFGTFQALLFCLNISFGSLKVINSIESALLGFFRLNSLYGY